MALDNLTLDERQFRLNVRNFLLVATSQELRKEWQMSIERGDKLRAACVQEIIEERLTEEAQTQREECNHHGHQWVEQIDDNGCSVAHSCCRCGEWEPVEEYHPA